ncbi:maltotransferase domain-containing protein, partial [Streptomyces beigongshangae]|uniref:maltotransferase domain-containing protein n=1 Tax=Streptomyces beigongshangae TaxID=2841597 RepID=UPI0021A86199
MPAMHHQPSPPPTPGTTPPPGPGHRAGRPQPPEAGTGEKAKKAAEPAGPAGPAGPAKSKTKSKTKNKNNKTKNKTKAKAKVKASRTAEPDERGGPVTAGPREESATAPAGPPGPAPASTPLIGRIPVLDVRPLVAGGRRPAKSVVGESFEISATVFREGHDAVAANVVLRGPDGRTGPWTPLRELAPGTDRWGATVSVPEPGLWTYTVEAWGDPISTWRHHAQIKIPAGIDTELVLEEGALLYERAAAGVPKSKGRRDAILAAVEALRDTERPAAARLAAALTPDVNHVLARHPLRELVTSAEPRRLLVERERALYGSWYEFFPRSEGAVVEPGRAPVSGTFRTAARRLPAIAEMGFDVVYLPPIHPIGTTFRKGPNNTLNPGPDDVGVPWAIGSPEGGHDAVHPDLGTIEDFDDFVRRAAELDLEIALDFALQCSPDHPWV